MGCLSKNLGVVMDGSLSFKDHIEHIFITSMYKMKTLYSFKNQLHQNIKLKLVKTLIYPQLDYCSSVCYNFLPQSNKNKLQRIQNACMRFVCCIPYVAHVTPYIRELNIEQRMQSKCVCIFKMADDNSTVDESCYKCCKSKVL